MNECEYLDALIQTLDERELKQVKEEWLANQSDVRLRYIPLFSEQIKGN